MTLTRLHATIKHQYAGLPVKIAIANDHTGLELKRELIALMEELGHEVADLGTQTPDSVDYPIYGVRGARSGQGV